MGSIAQSSACNGDDLMPTFSKKINGDWGGQSACTKENHHLTNGNSEASVTKEPSVTEIEVGIPKPINATASYQAINPIAYELSKLPFGTSRRLKIVVVGAGISALSLAHEVAIGRLKNVELKIIEKNAGLGGTWWENRYPGCACDIPSHNYLVRRLRERLRKSNLADWD